MYFKLVYFSLGMNFSEVELFLKDTKASKVLEIIQRNNVAVSFEDIIGKHPFESIGRNQIRKIFCHFYRNMKPDLVTEMKLLSTTELSWDHTFKTGNNTNFFIT